MLPSLSFPFVFLYKRSGQVSDTGFEIVCSCGRLSSSSLNLTLKYTVVWLEVGEWTLANRRFVVLWMNKPYIFVGWFRKNGTGKFWVFLFQWGGVSNSFSLSNRKWVNCQTTEITIVDSDSGIRLGKLSSNPGIGAGCDSVCSWLVSRLWVDIASGPRILNVLLNHIFLSMGCFWGPGLEEIWCWVATCPVVDGELFSPWLLQCERWGANLEKIPDPRSWFSSRSRYSPKDIFRVKRKCCILSGFSGLSSTEDF